jgi:uncharacterized protein (DUF952 family)
MFYHLTTEKAWHDALDRGIYTTASLQTEGFIHCSTATQLMESAEKHWKDHHRVVVLHIVDKRVKEILKWEPSRNEELFPHLYGKLEMDAVESTSLLERNDKGQFEWIK